MYSIFFLPVQSIRLNFLIGEKFELEFAPTEAGATYTKVSLVIRTRYVIFT